MTERERLLRAIENARYVLSPNQGEHPDRGAALRWLSSVLPPDHPAYMPEPKHEIPREWWSVEDYDVSPPLNQTRNRNVDG